MRSYWWPILAFASVARADNSTVLALSERSQVAPSPTTSAALELNNFVAANYGKDTSCKKSTATVYIPTTEYCTITSTSTWKTTSTCYETKISTCTETKTSTCTEVCQFEYISPKRVPYDKFRYDRQAKRNQ